MSVPVVIVNPHSAGGRTRTRWPRLEGQIREVLGPFQPLFTERAGHAIELARAALRDGAELVIALGGDGTINEVVNGFFQAGEDGRQVVVRPGAALGLMPAGTGGDFARTTSTPREITDSARRIADAAPRPIDVGRLTYLDHDGEMRTRHFINITSFGLGGLVDSYVNRSTKMFGGRVSFYLGTLRATLVYKNPLVRVSVDDGEPREQRIHTVAVANGRYFGGGMLIAPDARLDDGLFEVITIGDASPVRVVLEASGKIYSGKHLSLPYISATRARKVHAESAAGEEVLLDVDGEQPGRLPATFELVPGAIRLRA